MSTHVYGSRWVDCMRGAEGCQSDAEHDLRDQVDDLKRALDAAFMAISDHCQDCISQDKTCSECAGVFSVIRAIAEGVEP